jgi:hypothetical protein
MQNMHKRGNENIIPKAETFHFFAAVLMLLLIAVIAGNIYKGFMLPRKDFYNELWAPTYLLVRGQSPYDTASLNPVLPAAWLPMAIGFFFPLGWLSEISAMQVWYVFTILAICLIVYLTQHDRLNVYHVVVTALFCFFFPLTLNHINLGQFSITAVLCWLIAVRFWDDARFKWLSALLTAVALSKPHLGTLVMLGLLYHDYAHGGARRVISSVVWVAVMCLVLCLPLFIAYPNWIPDMLTSMMSNPPWMYPSLYILFGRYLSSWGTVAWLIVVLVVVGMNFRIWQTTPLKPALYWSLALAPLVTPYVGGWDFVVIFPLLIFIYNEADWKRKILIWVFYILAWVLMARVQMMEVSHNHFFWWVPLWFVAMSALVTAWVRMNAANSKADGIKKPGTHF